MFTFLKRAWVPIVVVIAVAIGGTAVDRLRGVFGSDEIFS
ncbi:MmpS family transport accessory protein, partial [Mycobacterium marinum]